MTHLSQTSAAACGGDCQTCTSAGSCADRVVCKCLKVTEETIIHAIRFAGALTVKELRATTAAGTGCMCCQKELKRYLTIYSSPAVVTV